MTTNNKPLREIRIGTVKAAVWNSNGKSGRPHANIAVSKLYKPKDSKHWKSTSYFDRDDLPVLIKVLDTLYTELLQPKPPEKEAGHE